MAWQTLPTLSNGGTPSHTDLNKFLGNLEYLHDPLFDSYEPTADTDLSTTSTTWASISSDYELSLTTSGGDVFILFAGAFRRLEIDISIDGTRLGSAPATTGLGIARNDIANYSNFLLPVYVTGLSAGAHTFHGVWKASSALGGTLLGANRPRFWVYEF